MIGIRHSMLIGALALVAAARLSAQASQSVIETGVIAAGGGTVGTGGNLLDGTIGQPFVPEGAIAGVDDELVWIGFWSVVPSDPTSVREERLARSIAATRISAAAPNPFTDRVAIDVDLAQSGHLVVSIHDGLGREVARLVDGERQIGAHRITWQPEDLASGSYLVRLELDGMVRATTFIQHYR